MENKKIRNVDKNKADVQNTPPKTKERKSLKQCFSEIREKIKDWRRKRRAARFENGEVELPVFRVGPNKKGVAVLWVLMAVSLAFGVYKNFTAIDKETIYERTVVESLVKDTNAVESFVERFAYLYHAWENNYDARNERQTALGRYITEELVRVNNGAVSSDCPTKSEVEDVRICELNDLGEGDFSVRYSVKQKLTEAGNVAGMPESEVHTTKQEEEMEEVQTESTEDEIVAEDTDQEEKPVEQEELTVTTKVETVEDESGVMTVTERESYYLVRVHRDENGDMVVVKNPTACGIPQKSLYAPAQKQTDGKVGASTMDEIKEFLDTFFSLYPSATEKELAYYAKPGTMEVINANYVYAGLLSPVYYMEEEKMMAHVYVQYLDQDAKVTQISEYTLTLEKGDNWKIVDAE